MKQLTFDKEDIIGRPLVGIGTIISEGRSIEVELYPWRGEQYDYIITVNKVYYGIKLGELERYNQCTTCRNHCIQKDVEICPFYIEGHIRPHERTYPRG